MYEYVTRRQFSLSEKLNRALYLRLYIGSVALCCSGCKGQFGHNHGQNQTAPTFPDKGVHNKQHNRIYCPIVLLHYDAATLSYRCTTAVGSTVRHSERYLRVELVRQIGNGLVQLLTGGHSVRKVFLKGGLPCVRREAGGDIATSNRNAS